MKKLMLATAVAAIGLATGNAFAVDCNSAPYGSSRSRYNEIASLMATVNADPTARVRVDVNGMFAKLCRAKFQKDITQRVTLRKLGMADSTIDDPNMDTAALFAQLLLRAADIHSGSR